SLHHLILHPFPTRRSSDLTPVSSIPRTCHIRVATSIPSPLRFCAIGRAPVWCMLAPDAATLLALRSRMEKERVHGIATGYIGQRSEEHTSELQSRGHLVCR